MDTQVTSQFQFCQDKINYKNEYIAKLQILKKATSKHLGAISQKADTLWEWWIHSYVIKEQCLWNMPIPANASWTFRKILKLKILTIS